MIKQNKQLSNLFTREIFGTDNLNDSSITIKRHVFRQQQEQYALVKYNNQMYLLGQMGNRYDGFALTNLEESQIHNENDIVSMYNSILFNCTK